jgi:hypothetical protein
MAVLISFVPALATGGDEDGPEREANGYRFQLVLADDLKEGSNVIGVKVTDLSGSPVHVSVIAVELHPMIAGDGTGGQVEEEAAPVPTSAHHMQHGKTENEHFSPVPTPIPTEAHHMNHEESEGGQSSSSTMDDMAGGHGHGESASVILEAAKEEGLYTGKVTFSEPGDWTLRVRFTLPDGTAGEELDFPVAVVGVGPPWGVLAGFLGINAIVVAAAGLIRRKYHGRKLQEESAT